MANMSNLRVQPTKPPTGASVKLSALDQILPIYTPLNLFFRPSSNVAEITQLQHFVASLQSTFDRLPYVAGSIREITDADGGSSMALVDDGRGADLLWVESTKNYADLPGGDSDDITPRPPFGNGDPEQTLLMVKFTKVS